jgi:parallel beta-helix repeat protein
MDHANHNIITGIEIYQIGEEGLHLRSFSSQNLVEKVWIHDVGLSVPEFGEGIYIGSAVSNWSEYSNNEPDRSDNNRIVGNLLGPNLTAEGIDIKEGTTGGIIRNNSFLTDHNLTADSWIDIKGNSYEVSHNLGTYEEGSNFRLAVDVLHVVDDWGKDNSISDNQEFLVDELSPAPFFATERVNDGITEGTYLLLVARPMPYTLSELAAYFPSSFQLAGAERLLLRESILVGRNASLRITTDDAHVVHMLSSPEHYVNIVGYLSQITISGLPDQKLDFGSWDPIREMPDLETSDGRAYILAAGSRLDIDNASFSDLGYEEGTVSGVAWKSLLILGETTMARGDVTNSSFLRNYFGAYTFEAVEMRWIGNVFADNIKYGFDPHDFSNYFLAEDNIARNNGSHGIIFSRGCSYNVIRGNKSFDNIGHGIMIDDGKLVPESDNERHHLSIPSNHNLIEDNFVTNNEDGIVLEGGEGNIIRNNTIFGSQRYGLRFKDNVIDTLVISNTIMNSGKSGLYIYNQSGHNEFRQNTIGYSPIGIVFQSAPQTMFTANTVNNINGSAIVLKGDFSSFVMEDNTFGGSGPKPIRAEGMTGLDVEKLWQSNDFSHWRMPAPAFLFYLALSVWLAIFIPPILMTLRRKVKL